MKMSLIICMLLVFGFHVFSQQKVQMKNGEKMNGQVKSLNNGIVEFLYKGSVKKINVTDIYTINFGEAGESVVTESQSTKQREVGEKQVTAGAYTVRYKVADRIINKVPKIDNLTQEKGTVVVEIRGCRSCARFQRRGSSGQRVHPATADRPRLHGRRRRRGEVPARDFRQQRGSLLARPQPLNS